jgi:phosphoenolpyruvate synthase/pyruvate phosphate dikinase
VDAANPLRQAHSESGHQVAVDMVNEGLIDKETAVMRVEPEHVDQMLHPQFDPNTWMLPDMTIVYLPAV